jgi:hypothetical protein
MATNNSQAILASQLALLKRKRNVKVKVIIGAAQKSKSLSLEEIPAVMTQAQTKLEALYPELQKYAESEAAKLHPIIALTRVVSSVTQVYETVMNIQKIVESVYPYISLASKFAGLWANPALMSEIAQDILAKAQKQISDSMINLLQNLQNTIMETNVELPEILAKQI